MEIELATQRALSQGYEDDFKKMKLDSATLKAQLLACEKKNDSLTKLLLEAQGQLREGRSAEMDELKRLAMSQAEQLVLSQSALEAHKKALNDQIRKYQRLRMYTVAMERHCQEAALNTLRVRFPRPDDLLPPTTVEVYEDPVKVVISMAAPVVTIPVVMASPLVVTTTVPPVTTVPLITTAPPVTTTPTTTVERTQVTTTTATPTPTGGENAWLRASGSGVLRAAMVNRPLIPGPSIAPLPVVFPPLAHVPIAAGGRLPFTRIIRPGIPTTSGIVRPKVTPVVPILPAPPKGRVDTTTGVMSGGVVTPAVQSALSGRGQTATSP